jgi:hypothetical protein
VTELEKLKVAKEVAAIWWEKPATTTILDWLDSEIARLEDPHAEAKKVLFQWQHAEGHFAGKSIVLPYVRHLESELAKAKAAAEPLDPKRVDKTACELTWGDTRRFIEGYEDAEPYEVTH